MHLTVVARQLMIAMLKELVSHVAPPANTSGPSLLAMMNRILGNLLVRHAPVSMGVLMETLIGFLSPYIYQPTNLNVNVCLTKFSNHLNDFAKLYSHAQTPPLQRGKGIWLQYDIPPDSRGA